MNKYPKFKTTFTRVMKLVGDCGRKKIAKEDQNKY